MSVSSVPAPTSGPSPFVMPESAGSAPPHPSLTPNPYGIPDHVVLDGVQRAADQGSNDLRNFYNAAIGDDLNGVADPKQSPPSRLLHAGLAAATVLTLPEAPELFGLKLAAKQTIKGGIERMTFHAAGEVAANGGKLVIDAGARLNPAESKVASELAARGHEVVAKAPSLIGRSADFIIDGKSTELKTMSNVRPDAANNCFADLVDEAKKQAPNIIIDARAQRGLTRENVQLRLDRLLSDSSKTSLKSVIVMGRDAKGAFEVKVSRR